MKYLNFEIQRTIRTPEVMCSPPEEVVAWLLLLAYCCEKENGGTIAACGDWSPRMWLTLAGVDGDVIKRPSRLWTWDGGSLAVAFYPVSQEATYHRQREAGVETQRKLRSRREEKREPEGKGKEGKGKEQSPVRSPVRSPSRSPESVPFPSPRAAGQGRHRNPVDTYAGAEDYDDLRGSG